MVRVFLTGVPPITGRAQFTYKDDQLTKDAANAEVSLDINLQGLPDLNAVKRQVIAQLDRVTENVELRKILESMVGQEFNLDLEADPPLPQDELDKQTWLKNYQGLQSAQRKVDLGIIPITDAPYSDLKKLVITTYKPEYLQLG